MKPEEIINLYYAENPELRELLTAHSKSVAQLALRLAERYEHADRDFIYEAAMLHDIGIIRCDAPGILCHGREPYLRHGIIGGEMLREHGMPRHARVCERHTGSGLSAMEIAAGKLPLPAADYLPETIEEKVICYADKFYSKSGNPVKMKNFEYVREGMARHGVLPLQRFDELVELFGIPAGS